MYRRTSNSTTTLAEVNLPTSHAARPIDAGGTYHLHVVREGAEIRFHVDGHLVLRVADATFETGRVGLSTYRTHACFDNLVVRPYSRDPVLRFEAGPGVRDVGLLVTDAAGQTAFDTIPVATNAGDPPSADAGGPYRFDEFTGEAESGLFTVAFDGRGSSDPEGSPLAYQWDLGTNTFDGATVDELTWVTGGAVAQDDALRITGTGSWGRDYAYSRSTFARAEGLTFEARVTAQSNAMLGWKNTSASGHYNQLVNGLYFNSGNLVVYEGGRSRGTRGAYERNAAYDVRIVLKGEAGARYSIRRAGAPSWDLVYDSAYGDDARLRKAVDTSTGLLVLDDLRELAAGPTPTYPLLGVGDHPVTLTVTDPAGQRDSADTVVTLAANDPPVANAGPDQDVLEAGGVAGVWDVAFDGSGSGDDHGVFRYEWDWSYDPEAGFEPSGVLGVNPRGSFLAGVHTVALRVTDHALQTSVDTMALSIVAGEPPVAVPGGPYVFDEFTGEARDGAWHAALDGTGSTDDQSDLIYSWDLGNETFAGNVLNATEWSATGQASQNDGLRLVGTSSWGANTLFARDGRARLPGYFFEASVTLTAGGAAMIGLKNDSAIGEYRQLQYAVYFTSAGVIRIYESGSNRGDVSPYAAGGRYDVRIVPKAGAGARYYFKAHGAGVWTLLYDSDHGNVAELRPGLDVHSGTFTVHSMRDIVGGATPRHRVYRGGERDVQLTVTDFAGQSHTAATQLTLVGNDPPVADGGPDRDLGEAAAAEGMLALFLNAIRSTDDHGIMLYEWDLDYDGRIFDVDSTGPEVFRQIQDLRPFNIGLRVSDHVRQTHIDVIEVRWRGGTPPVADAGNDVFTEGLWPVQFDGTRSTDDVGIARFEWDFGDGSTGSGPRPSHTYWDPGIYVATLTVHDRIGQSDSDTVSIVRRIANEPPVAAAGGPYEAGAGGPPAHFDGLASGDDFGVVKYLWDVDAQTDSDGDGDPDNDIDLVGPRPMFTYAEAGAYTVTLTVVDGADQVSRDAAVVNVRPDLPPEVVCVPWVGVDPLSRHEVIAGVPTRLKAVVRDGGALTYQWDFGDGSDPWPAEPAAVANARYVEATHTYDDVPDDTPYSATLTIWDAGGNEASDQYHLVVKRDDLDVRVNIAIDEALWWLHKSQAANGRWQVSGSYTACATGSALQAFQINGHRFDGDHRENPYADTVQRGFDYLFTRLTATGIEARPWGDPDSDGNGAAVDTTESRQPYQLGMVMDGIATSGNPLAIARTGPVGIKGRFFHRLMVDMADRYMWGQHARGGWRYTWNSGPDNSGAQWGAIGLVAAQDLFDITIPQFAKNQNLDWVRRSFGGYGFGYASRGNQWLSGAGTPSGMVQLAFTDVTSRDAQWRAAEDHIATHWEPERAGPYALFALVKSLRLARPLPIERFEATALDWYNHEVVGVRRLVSDTMLRAGASWGAWNGTQGSTGRMLNTAWAVIMLTPSLFVQPPTADAGGDIHWAFDVPLRFDGTGSRHPDPIRSVTLYEWDFDADGVYDLATDDPRDPRAVWTYPDPNPDEDGDEAQTYRVKLRVTDDSVPPQTDTDIREVLVSELPYAPFADLGGPYVVGAGTPFVLDGSGSFDLDPLDRILGYEWDLDHNGVFFEDIDVDSDEPTATHIFPEVGRYDIALRVYDSGRENPRGCDPAADCVVQVSRPVFTTVVVNENRPPVAIIVPPDPFLEGGVGLLDASPSFDPDGAPVEFEWSCAGVELRVAGGGLAELDASAIDAPRGGVEYACVLTVTDFVGAESSVEFTVEVINRPPVVERVEAPVAADEGATVQVRVTATDPAPADAARLLYSVDCDGDSVLDVLDAFEPVLSCTFPENGVFTIAVVVDDDDDGTAVARAEPITVGNVAPTIAAVECPASSEGTPIAIQLVVTDPGGEHDPVACALVAPAPDGAQLDARDCLLLWTPNYTQALAGEVEFTVVATDDEGATGQVAFRCTPALLDEDEDGLPDTWEVEHGLDPAVNDCDEDPDGDGLSNCEEFDRGHDPGVYNGAPPPVLISPIEEAVVDTRTPDLVLENTRDALDRPIDYEYHVFVDEDLVQRIIISDRVGSGVGTTRWPVPEGTLDDNTWYWWSARPLIEDAVGEFADAEAFLVDAEPEPPTPPRIAWPEDGDVLAVTDPVFVLDNGTDPDPGDTLRYVCQVARDAAFEVVVTQGEADEGPDGQTEVPVDDGLEENTRYHARCRAIDDAGLESEWSEPTSFTIDTANEAPNAPTIVFPMHATVVEVLGVVLTAEPAVDPEGEALTYKFWLGTDPAFAGDDTIVSEELAFAEGAEQVTFALPALLEDNTVYFWRVRARDPLVGGPAATARFLVDLGNEAPTVPKPIAPEGVSVPTPTFRWGASVDPEHEPITYEIELSAADGDEPIWRLGGLVERRVDYDAVLDYGEYLWTARAVDERGAASDWAAPVAFVVEAPPPIPDAAPPPPPPDMALPDGPLPDAAVDGAVEPDLELDMEVVDAKAVEPDVEGDAQSFNVTGAGCECDSAGGPGLPWLALLALVGLRRRRR